MMSACGSSSFFERFMGCIDVHPRAIRAGIRACQAARGLRRRDKCTRHIGSPSQKSAASFCPPRLGVVSLAPGA
jgi:hypothetical protein